MRRRGSSPGLGRQRSRYFEHAFGTSRDTAELEERVKSQAMVIAELKTSVFVSNLILSHKGNEEEIERKGGEKGKGG